MDSMQSEVFLLLSAVTFFCHAGVSLNCYNDANCTAEAGTRCNRMSSGNCLCKPVTLYLQPCVGNLSLKLKHNLSATRWRRPKVVKVLKEKLKLYSAKSEKEEETFPGKDYYEGDEAENPEEEEDHPKEKEHQNEDINYYLGMHIFGITVGVFIGIIILLCLCSVGCILGIIAVVYYARNSKD